MVGNFLKDPFVLCFICSTNKDYLLVCICAAIIVYLEIRQAIRKKQFLVGKIKGKNFRSYLGM